MKTTKPKVVTASYGNTGYEIWLNGMPVQRFGNHRHDSYQYAMVGSPEALTLKQIRSLASTSAREYANEKGLGFGGVEREEYLDERICL